MSSARSERPARDESRAAGRPRAWSSLAARLAVWYVLVTLAAFLLAVAVFALRARAALERVGNQSAAGALESYRAAFESGGTTALRAMFDCSSGTRLALRLTDERDTELFEMSSDPDSRRTAVRLDEPGRAVEPAAGWHMARAAVSQQRKLSLVMRDDRSASLWQELRETSWAIFGSGLALAIAGATLITRRALRPVTDLVQATESIVASGDLTLRVKARSSADELAQLTRLFNRMLAKNEGLVRAMRESLEYVAHDLRTPLTRLRAGAELALGGPADSVKQREALADVIDESDRVLAMLTTLTDIVAAEAGAMHLDRHQVDLAELAREAAELYEYPAKEAGLSIVTHLDREIRVSGDRRRLSQVCANLLDNAVKYTPAGGRVELSVFADAGEAVLRVSDTGIGIAPEDQARVWDRLFRADRSRGEPGLGLGLALVKAVVEAHGGRVMLESVPRAGATFEIRLPRAAAGETPPPSP